MENMINSIEINKIKGKEKIKIELENCLPNIPHIVVAPNGYGKTTISTAFQSLNNNRLDLHKDNSFKGGTNADSKIILETKINNNCCTLEANYKSNSINKEYDVFVIRDIKKAVAKKMYISGQMVTTSSIELEPIILVKTIPEKKELNYQYSKNAIIFGKNTKLAHNLSELINTEEFVTFMIINESIFTKIDKRENKKYLENLIMFMKNQTGSKIEVINKIEAKMGESIISETINEILCRIIDCKLFGEISIPTAMCIVLQLKALYIENSKIINEIKKYYSYLKFEREFISTITQFNINNRIVVNKDKKSLILTFPKSNQISNGERDIIVLIAKIWEFKSKIKNKQSILIFDEVFDYFDDVNIIAAQYYINKFIKESKEEKKIIYPIIFSHLDPDYFRNFLFKNLKITYVMNNHKVTFDRELLNIIKNREEPTISKKVSKSFLHYCEEEYDLNVEFKSLNLSDKYDTTTKFRNIVLGEIKKYISDERYDALKILCALRICVEKILYIELDENQKTEFIDINGTTEKIDFVIKNCDNNVPENFKLLGILYNEALHLKDNTNKLNNVCSKLENMIIKKMVKDIFIIYEETEKFAVQTE